MTSQTVPINGLDFHVKIWPVPEGVEEKGRIIYNHGWCEQIFYYDPTMPIWTRLGFEVIGFDQRGAGKTSPGSQFAVTNEKFVFEDLDAIVKMYTEGYKKKVFMFGHSMGAAILLNYAVKGVYRERIDGFAAFGPLVVVHQMRMPNIVLQKAMNVIAKYWPSYRQIVDPQVESCTSDPKWQEYLRTRPGHRTEATAAQMNDMFKRGRALLDPEYVHKFVKRPVLVCVGTDDTVNDPLETEKFFGLLTVPDRKFIKYEGARHCLFWEKDELKAKFFEDVERWVLEHSEGTAKVPGEKVVDESGTDLKTDSRGREIVQELEQDATADAEQTNS